jgi:phospholipase C
MFSKMREELINFTSVSAIFLGLSSSILLPVQAQEQNTKTLTPIKQVIIIVGENRSFDHLFGAYQPRSGQKVSNSLSKGIINADGTPGSNFNAATQYQASVTSTFSLSHDGSPYDFLPPPKTDGAPQVATDNLTDPTNPVPPPFQTLDGVQAFIKSFSPEGIYLLAQDLGLLTTGATGLPAATVDTRIPNVNNLPNGPFQLTSQTLPYDSYESSPVHRFYQAWQQADCDIQHATQANPSGCLNGLFPWVETTVGAGSNGNPPPSGGFVSREGSTAMGFYNVNAGDLPYFKNLADNYTLADNYHQPVMGGTGANSIMLGFGDALWYSDGQGNVATPPTNQIENPNPQDGTNNFYTQDGYSGGSFSNCSDPSQPGVGPILNYLGSLPYQPKPNCASGHYYLLNNYDPGYYGDGSVDSVANTKYGVSNGGFVIPPSPVPSIGDVLNQKNVSWRYYGEGWNEYLKNPTLRTNVYCNICNPFQYQTSIMTNEQQRQEHLKDVTDFDQDVANSTLPAVSYLKPGGLLDGHPASSKWILFEGFTKRVIQRVQSKPELWKDTAILITEDEGGGYWDSGYIQPVDFFGDGSRIPLIVVSPYSVGGRVVHTYYDHASILKFIEKNWRLPTISQRSRDNLPNPVVQRSNPYVPTNGPAIGDLVEMFRFPKQEHQDYSKQEHEDELGM